jgi:hypothetical protein
MSRISKEKLEWRDVEGYRWKPEDPVWGEVGAKLTAEVWPKEDWNEKGIGRDRIAPPGTKKRR